MAETKTLIMYFSFFSIIIILLSLRFLELKKSSKEATGKISILSKAILLEARDWTIMILVFLLLYALIFH